MDLEETLLALRRRREGALMPHVYYGDPNSRFSHRLIETLAGNGADFIEFGIPFSDPTADGPTFQAACERALRNGTTPSSCIKGMKELSKNLGVPFIITTYYNIPYVAGVDVFLREIKAAGAQGIIVPNLPIEEAGPLLEEGERQGVHVILLVAPTTTEERLRKIAEMASGFIYVMNVEGVTGARDSLRDSTLRLVRRVRRHTDIPVLAGFGISRREQAEALVSAGADGVVAGSVFTKIYEARLDDPTEALPDVAEMVRELKLGCVKKQRPSPSE
jgi:tryptophan synthase alpha chain